MFSALDSSRFTSNEVKTRPLHRVPTLSPETALFYSTVPNNSDYVSSAGGLKRKLANKGKEKENKEEPELKRAHTEHTHPVTEPDTHFSLSKNEVIDPFVEQILLIESCLKDHLLESNDVMFFANRIMDDPGLAHRDKMAELGALLYYVDRGYNFSQSPPSCSFCALLSKEIAVRIYRLVAVHREALGEKVEDIPSGKNYFIISTLTRLLVTERQKVNLAGFYTIQKLVNDPASQIAAHIPPEHREYIVKLAATLQSSSAIKTLVEEVTAPHPSLEEYIRIDLKLEQSEQVSSLHVVRSAFLALFSDLRQTSSSNCFAIAPLLYAMNNYPERVLARIFLLLRQGYLSLPGDILLPIYSLVDHQLHQDVDLSFVLEQEHAHNLTIFRRIAGVLNLPIQASVSSYEDTLEKHFKEMLRAGGKGSWGYAKKLYRSFSINTLLSMLIATFQFEVLNLQENKNDTTPFSMDKSSLVNSLVSLVDFNENEVFTNRLIKLIEKAIWFIDYPEEPIEKSDGVIALGRTSRARELKTMSAQTGEMVKLLKDAVYLYVVHAGQQRLVTEISSLQLFMMALAEEVGEALNISEEKREEIRKKIRSKDFANGVAIFCSMQALQVEKEILLENDLLIFRQSGGFGWSVLKRLFQVKCLYKIGESTNAYTLLKSISPIWYELQTRPQGMPYSVLFESLHHTFHLLPNKSFLLKQGELSFDDFLDVFIFSTAENFLDQSVPFFKIERILLRLQEEKLLKVQLYGDSWTYRTLRENLLQGQDEEKIRAIGEILDDEFWTIELNRLDLDLALRRLNINLNKEAIEVIMEELNSKSHALRSAPYQWARVISRALTKHRIAVIDPSEIELEICHLKSLPPCIYMGDLNYGTRRGEGPWHTTLVIRYNFSLKTLCFFNREKHGEQLEEEGEFHRYDISYY